MKNPLLGNGAWCPHCKQYVDVIYGEECANCGESIYDGEEDYEDDYEDDIFAEGTRRCEEMNEYLGDTSDMRDYEILNCKLSEATVFYICHQIDCEGKMNAQVAQELLAKYPRIKEEYADVRNKVLAAEDLLGGFCMTRLGEDDYDFRLPRWCFSLCTHLEGEDLESREYYERSGCVPADIVYAERLAEALDRINEEILCESDEIAFAWKPNSTYWEDVTLTLILKKLTRPKKIYFCKED